MRYAGKIVKTVDNGVGPDKQSRVRIEFADGTALEVRVEREVESRLSGSPALPTGALTVKYEPVGRRVGVCPLGTPGCGYGDCSPAPGRSCSSPDAPPHVDMLGGPGDRLEGTDIRWPR